MSSTSPIPSSLPIELIEEILDYTFKEFFTTHCEDTTGPPIIPIQVGHKVRTNLGSPVIEISTYLNLIQQISVLLSSTHMDKPIEIYSDDELTTNPDWIESDWINVGKKYINVPKTVTHEHERLLFGEWFWGSMVQWKQACMAFSDWSEAMKWLEKTPTSVSAIEEDNTKQTILSLLNKVSWQGTTPGIQTKVNNHALTDVLGDKLLGMWTLDAMLAKLRLQLKYNGDTSTIIPPMEFLTYLKNRNDTPTILLWQMDTNENSLQYKSISQAHQKSAMQAYPSIQVSI
ncbi:hypothetical protein IW261DRAFT_1424009 [Armillaria novae-zelandiae]|uniref:Uncharacterized protein n=1 Tax=Armillaria novae-zelandiae TaxID=153914 RepID=A0AA39NWS7_9AGAR|nr:hypothetical protein IW261DRAFT_1424009 [Armillaria novae-zelandiae]